MDLLLPQKLDIGGRLGQKGPKELPLSDILKSLPKPYQDWVKKVKDELQLPEVEIIVKMDTTTMCPQEAIQVCIEERVPLFCAGLGNPGFMVEEAHAAGMKVLGIPGNARNARRMAQYEEMDNLLKGCAISSLKDTPHNKGRTFSKMITAYLKPIVQIAIHSGMRRGEIVNLQWRDIDFKVRRILFEKTKNKRETGDPHE